MIPVVDLILVRHAQCQAQVDAGLLGDHDSELTEVGHRQAVALAVALRESRFGQPGHIWSSPLVRALDTAIPTAQALGLPIHVHPELREAQPSRSLTGRGRRELSRRHGQLSFDPAVGDDGWEHGDASYEAMTARADRILMSARQDLGPGARVVLFTHGAFGGFLISAAVGIPPATPSWFVLDNASVSVLRLPEPGRPGFGMFPPHRAQILVVNEVEHLPGDLRKPDPLD